jgi:hypothetical protein
MHFGCDLYKGQCKSSIKPKGNVTSLHLYIKILANKCACTCFSFKNCMDDFQGLGPKRCIRWNETMTFSGKQMELELFILNKISQTNITYFTSSGVCRSQKYM